MMNKKYIVAAILATAVSSNAFAEEKKNEISAFVYANQQTNPSGQKPLVTVYASYGKYIRENIAITGSVNVTKAGGTNMGGFGIGGKYYFKVGQKGEFVPFALAELQLGMGSSSGLTLYYGNIAVGGGASYFITETASIDGRLQYQAGSTDSCLGGYCSSSSTSAIMAIVGLTQRF